MKSTKGDIELSPSFAKSVHTYTATVPDNSSSVYVWRTNSRGSCTAVYSMLSTASDCGKTNEVTLESRFEGDGLAKFCFRAVHMATQLPFA